mmetsp:Transcript_16637/g.36268  ORF Transcript_16637/g.36268 Transcript_16637/m.36268 type:complete len:89 (-) Transcript_16637:385-651(-)
MEMHAPTSAAVLFYFIVFVSFHFQRSTMSRQLLVSSPCDSVRFNSIRFDSIGSNAKPTEDSNNHSQQVMYLVLNSVGRNNPVVLHTRR